MKYRQRIIVLVLSFLAVNGVTSYVLVRNLGDERYPIDGDSIGLPMLLTFFLGLFCLLLLSLAVKLVYFDRLVRFSDRGVVQRVCVIFLLVGLSLLPLALMVSAAGFWSMPHHWTIAWCLFAVASIVVLLLGRDVWWLVSGTQRRRRC